jgi:pullulanase/glycogen debranching enzyme
MDTKMDMKKIFRVLGAFAVAMSLQTANAQNLDQLRQTAQAGTNDAVSSQSRINKLDDETDQLTRDYRAALKQLASLREYNAQLEKLIAAQKTEMAFVRQQIEDVTHVDRAITPLMFRMIDALEQFVKLDVPFLAEERKARIANLRSLMDRSDANPAEKYRKILEAYEIENEYGRTIEAYEGEMDISGEDRTVAFLRIGRVALIYQTLDAATSGAWDNEARAFVDLDGDFDSELRSALRIAKQQAAPDLLIVPVKINSPIGQ